MPASSGVLGPAAPLPAPCRPVPAAACARASAFVIYGVLRPRPSRPPTGCTHVAVFIFPSKSALPAPRHRYDPALCGIGVPGTEWNFPGEGVGERLAADGAPGNRPRTAGGSAPPPPTPPSPARGPAGPRGASGVAGRTARARRALRRLLPSLEPCAPSPWPLPSPPPPALSGHVRARSSVQFFADRCHLFVTINL